MFCIKCGSEIHDSAIICPNCGCATPHFQQQKEQPNVVINNTNTNRNTAINGIGIASPKSKIVALVLCFFLGWLGAHRYYVGKIGTGIIWTCTFGMFGIGALIDFFLILFNHFTDKWGRPLIY